MITNRLFLSGVAQEDLFLSVADEDVALLMYALLDDEDLKEVFGEFLVPAASILN